MSDPYDFVITRKPQPETPPFVCVCCERTIVADPWRSRGHKPPVCFSCANYYGHQVRIPKMTRGDHHTLQRLVAVTDTLLRVAHWKVKRWH